MKNKLVLSKSLSIAGVLLVFGLAVSVWISKTVRPTTNSEYSATSVMITRFDGRSGGTGVVTSSSRSESKILTNAHVCSLLNAGGIVRSDRYKGVVKYFQVSDVHDLCLITVSSNFHVNTVLADTAPEPYDDAIVSGHPHLLPNIITRGHFSQKEIVQVITGFRPCTIEDVTGGENAEYCQTLGFVPLIKSYEAQVVSATIMPGSSGSAVYNSNGEIAGLVFAGSGEFGYGMIVPYEYVSTFFDIELPSIKAIFPNKDKKKSSDGTKINWRNVCSHPSKVKIKKVCDLVSRSLLLTN